AVPLRAARLPRRRQGGRQLRRLQQRPRVLRRAARARGRARSVVVRRGGGMSGGTDLLVTGVTAAVAVAAGPVVGSLGHLGAAGLARYRQLFTERANVSLRELFLFVDPVRLWIANLALTLLAAPLAWLVSGSWVPAAVVAVAVALGPRFALGMLRRRRLAQ